jgi:hypothetical protein
VNQASRSPVLYLCPTKFCVFGSLLSLVLYLAPSTHAYEQGSLFLFEIREKAESPIVSDRIQIEKEFFKPKEKGPEERSDAKPRTSTSFFGTETESPDSEKTETEGESEFVIDFSVLKTESSGGSFSSGTGVDGLGSKEPPADESAPSSEESEIESIGFGF